MNLPLSDQIACVKREIGLRERVYPRWIEKKRMSQQKADHEMEAMRAVLVSLEEIAARQRLL